MRAWCEATYPEYFNDWLSREAKSGFYTARPIGHSEGCLCETCMDWPYVYTTAAERQSDAPYAFWLGKDGNPLDGSRLWENS
jgi:hypothetical protein